MKKLAWACVLAFGLAGCGGNAPTGSTPGAGSGTGSTPGGTSSKAPVEQANPSEAKEIRIGYLANIVMPQPLVGLQEGEFEKRVPGIKFSGRDFPAGPEVMEALRAGVVDIAYTGPTPPMNGFLKNGDIILLASAAKGGTALMVSNSSPVKTVADLKGKVVGVNQVGSTVDALVRHNLLKAGLTPGKDVRIIEVKPAEQASAIKGNQVAAVAAPAPWPSQVVKNGNGRALLDWKQINNGGNYLAGVAFTTRKFADANPGLVAQFVNAHKSITKDLNANRAAGDARVLAAWSKVTKKKLDPAVAKAAFSTIQFSDAASQSDFQRDMEISLQVGFLKKKGSLDGFLWSENPNRKPAP